jgi:two-component system NtrC family sensor kinase
MHFFSFLAAFMLALRISRAIKFTALHEKWRMILRISAGVPILLFIIFNERLSDDGVLIVASIYLLLFIEYLKKQEDFKSFTVLLNAHYPLVAAGIISGSRTHRRNYPAKERITGNR